MERTSDMQWDGGWPLVAALRQRAKGSFGRKSAKVLASMSMAHGPNSQAPPRPSFPVGERATGGDAQRALGLKRKGVNGADPTSVPMPARPKTLFQSLGPFTSPRENSLPPTLHQDFLIHPPQQRSAFPLSTVFPFFPFEVLLSALREDSRRKISASPLICASLSNNTFFCRAFFLKRASCLPVSRTRPTRSFDHSHLNISFFLRDSNSSTSFPLPTKYPRLPFVPRSRAAKHTSRNQPREIPLSNRNHG